MNGPTTEPLEAILQHCAAVAPEPWYPRLHAEANGIERDSLDPALERLRLGGLIRLTDWMPGKGQGYVLTPEGKEALGNRRTLVRSLSGPQAPRRQAKLEATAADAFDARRDRAHQIRDGFLSTRPPVVTYALIAANLSVFIYGIYLAKQDGLPLPGMMDVAAAIPPRTGAVSAADLLRGEWWRLLTSCFVHLGWVHLGMNMLVLYNLGPISEKIWGSMRFLLLYLVSGFGGSCIAMLVKPLAAEGGPPVELAGASGAIWGLMVAMAVWVFLNRGYLPYQLAATWQRQLGTMIVLNIFISFLPGISAAGHFGGGGVGLVMAVLLQAQRFGAGPARALGWLGLPLVPVACATLLGYAEAHSPAWQELARRVAAERELQERRDRREIEVREANEFEKEVVPKVRRLDLQAKENYAGTVGPRLEEKPSERDPAAVKSALAELAKAKAKLADAAKLLDEAGPYQNPRLEQARLVRREFLEERIKLFDVAEKCLRAGKTWTADDEEAFRHQGQRLREAEHRWFQLLQ